MIRASVVFLLFSAHISASPAADLVVNGGFEKGFAGWENVWSRTPSIRAALDSALRASGAHAARVEHTGRKDWSLAQARRLKVKPGEIYELSGRLRKEGEGTTTLCVILRDSEGGTLDWVFGGRTLKANGKWRLFKSRFLIPEKGATIQVRVIGERPATVWIDDIRLAAAGSVDRLKAKNLPSEITVKNRFLRLDFNVSECTLSVTDLRNGKEWKQFPFSSSTILEVRKSGNGFTIRLLENQTVIPLSAEFRPDPEKPEFTITLSGKGEMPRAVRLPPPFRTRNGDFLIMPVNEGIAYPVDDRTLKPMWYHLYGGHGLCMAWYGVTNGGSGFMTMVETPNDAAVAVPRRKGLLCLAPEWLPQKRRFGYPRRLRYVLFDRGGYVAMAKRYRQRSKRTGLFKTLSDKRKENPSVDLLVGAVNVWCWDMDPAAVCLEMQSLGIKRILWSHRSNPRTLKRLNAMNVLTSRYDIYQDVMNPANFPKLRGVHSDWTTEAWAKDIIIDADGDWVRGWRVKGKDGKWYPCGIICDKRAVAYARRRIPPELETHPYRCRFIDTTTAAPWHECYSSDHPMTRSESRKWKMKLLAFVSRECRLVTGSETGHEAAVPFVHYFEGMLSLGPYRVPDAGRNMLRIVDKAPERVAKFQTGHFYRIPLWELVYHDCVVAQWYWGDYNNKIPSLWDRRDLFNALYGTPPMFMFNRAIWRRYRDRFVRSYLRATPVARKTGYVEMLSHEWLTPDHSVQRTCFANGVTVTVNFGDKPHRLPDGTLLEPLSSAVTP